MKNLVKHFGIIILVAVIGFTACFTAEEGDPVVVSDEYRDVETVGRLTINGLSTYEGQFIAAHVTLPDHIYLVAFDQLSNGYLEGKLVKDGSKSTNSTVVNGQATLKVFKEKNGSGFYEDYNGNDQNVVFYAGTWNEGDEKSTDGTVTVNFTNGIGSGVFVPKTNNGISKNKISVFIELPKSNISIYTDELLPQITHYSIAVIDHNGEEIATYDFQKKASIEIELELTDTEIYKIYLIAYNNGAMIGKGITQYYRGEVDNYIQILLEPFDISAYQIIPNVDIGKSDYADGGPRSIITDNDGALYIADSLNNKVIKMNQGGQQLKSWTSTYLHGEVERIFYKNSKLYVIIKDAVNEYKNYLNVLDTELNLITKFELPIKGSGYGEGICVDNNMNVYIIDGANYKILKYSSDDSNNYSLVLEWGSRGNGLGQFDWGYNTNLVIDEYDNIYVPDYINKRVQKFDTSGNLLFSIDGNSLFQAYIGISLDNDNSKLYILDVYNNQIHIYTFDGNYYTTIKNENLLDNIRMQYPSSISYYDNKLYLLDFNNALATYSNNKILVIEVH